METKALSNSSWLGCRDFGSKPRRERILCVSAELPIMHERSMNALHLLTSCLFIGHGGSFLFSLGVFCFSCLDCPSRPADPVPPNPPLLLGPCENFKSGKGAVSRPEFSQTRHATLVFANGASCAAF